MRPGWVGSGAIDVWNLQGSDGPNGPSSPHLNHLLHRRLQWPVAAVRPTRVRTSTLQLPSCRLPSVARWHAGGSGGDLPKLKRRQRQRLHPRRRLKSSRLRPPR